MNRAAISAATSSYSPWQHAASVLGEYGGSLLSPGRCPAMLAMLGEKAR